jgi:VWFA-related protein
MISPTRLVSIALVFALSLAPAAIGQNPTVQSNSAQSGPAGQSQKQEPSVRLRTDEVVVDAIVTDKKNRPVMNLTADDFDVFEDGVKQRIASFRVESSAQTDQLHTAPGLAPSRSPGGGAAAPGKLVAMVFDSQTTRDTALLARRAALDYVDSGIGPDDFVAVFAIDQNLMVLAPFTQDKAALKRAIEAFTSRESKKYNAVAGEVLQALEGLVTPLSDAEKLNIADTMTTFDAIPPEGPAALVPGSRAAAPNQIDPNRVTRTQILLAALRSLRTFNIYEKQFQALRVVDALLAIINGESSVRATRKTLLFFSEGLSVPANTSDQFVSVISAANKAGVTIYALDVAGLRVVNPSQESMLERDAAAAKRIRNQSPELVTDGASALGKMEDVARMDNLSTLDELSEQTGGYTVKNTNDLVEGLRRVVEALGNYYVMTYLPTNENYDGKFRRITVKLKNPAGLQLRARQGYFALRTLDNAPVMMGELPLLDLANRPSAQSDFPLYAQALHFKGTAQANQVAVYLEFPMSGLKFETDDKTKTFSSRFAVLMLVKNDSGVIVRKLGQEYRLHGPASQLDEVSKNTEMYSRLILLEPGKYMMDGVARDSISGKSSVVHGSFEVPAVAGGGLGMSSVVLSRGVNPLSEEQKHETAHPLYLEGQAYFVPNVTEGFSIGSDKNMLVHFNVYEPGAGSGKVSASLDFYRNGRIIAQSSGSLPDPDATGKIAYSTSFGLGAFSPGEYELVVTATGGTGKASSVARFKIRP